MVRTTFPRIIVGLTRVPSHRTVFENENMGNICFSFRMTCITRVIFAYRMNFLTYKILMVRMVPNQFF